MWPIARQKRLGGTSGQREELDESRYMRVASKTLKKLDIWYRGEITKPCDRMQITRNRLICVIRARKKLGK